MNIIGKCRNAEIVITDNKGRLYQERKKKDAKKR